jgi:membrane protein YdbS with pleckstrin-like domain
MISWNQADGGGAGSGNTNYFLNKSRAISVYQDEQPSVETNRNRIRGSRERKKMESKRFKPVEALRTFWLTVWFVWLVVGFLAGATPAILETVFGLPIRGLLPSLITDAALLLIMIPVGIWLPAYHRSIEYGIDSEAVRSKRGVFWKRVTTVPFHKITNIDITQGPVQRAFGIGTVHVQTAGAGGSQGGQAELLLQGIDDLEGVRDRLLARAVETGPDLEVKRTQAALHGSSEPILEELSRIRRLLESYRK